MKGVKEVKWVKEKSERVKEKSDPPQKKKKHGSKKRTVLRGPPTCRLGAPTTLHDCPLHHILALCKLFFFVASVLPKDLQDPPTSTTCYRRCGPTVTTPKGAIGESYKSFGSARDHDHVGS